MSACRRSVASTLRAVQIQAILSKDVKSGDEYLEYLVDGRRCFPNRLDELTPQYVRRHAACGFQGTRVLHLIGLETDAGIHAMAFVEATSEADPWYPDMLVDGRGFNPPIIVLAEMTIPRNERCFGVLEDDLVLALEFATGCDARDCSDGAVERLLQSLN